MSLISQFLNSKLNTTATVVNANCFPLFVDSNNTPSSAVERVFTTSSFTVNPSTGEVDILGRNPTGSTITGALVVTGGIGVGGGLFVGDISTFTNITFITNTTNVASTNTGALQVRGGVGVAGGGFFGGVVTATSFTLASGGPIGGTPDYITTTFGFI